MLTGTLANIVVWRFRCPFDMILRRIVKCCLNVNVIETIQV